MARILVAEDNPDIALALAVLLRRNGHDVTRAADGEEALQVATELHPELVVLDIGLPRLDGWGVLARIRARATSRCCCSPRPVATRTRCAACATGPTTTSPSPSTTTSWSPGSTGC